MNTINYLKENGIESLKAEFDITVKEYEDRYVLNYNQIDSPRFHPICDECRGLILDKNFDILARSFTRFFNFGEGIDGGALGVKDLYGNVHELDIKDAKIYHKMDGSCINIYWDYLNSQWQVATRGMAFAEGGMEFFDSFDALAQKSIQYKSIIDYLNSESESVNDNTFIFELTSPFNRIVTPYSEVELTLLAVKRSNGTEYSRNELESVALDLGVQLPSYYTIDSWEELQSLVNEFPSMQEGVVLVWEDCNRVEGHYRLKCKNVQYVAIHNLRSNGLISPYRILTLVMGNEEKEYLNYFSEDSKYFDFVKSELTKLKVEVAELYEKFKDIESQKDFAIAIMGNVTEKFYTSFLFEMRKGKTLDQCFEKFNGDGKKLSKMMDLKYKFIKHFNLILDESED